MTNLLTRLKNHAQRLKRELYALYLAQRDPRTPWYAKVMSAIVIGYAFSPIDLIPDFIPILGYLDDLILLPLGIYVVLRLIPDEVMKEARTRVSEMPAGNKPVSRTAAVIIVLIWLFVITQLLLVFVRYVR